MQGIERRGTRARLVAFPMLVALVLVLVWALLPDIGLGVLLLLGVSAEALVYLGFYLVERRRHW